MIHLHTSLFYFTFITLMKMSYLTSMIKQSSNHTITYLFWPKAFARTDNGYMPKRGNQARNNESKIRHVHTNLAICLGDWSRGLVRLSPGLYLWTSGGGCYAAQGMERCWPQEAGVQRGRASCPLYENRKRKIFSNTVIYWPAGYAAAQVAYPVAPPLK